MNKELINKYKPEFDHWLNDGSVLIKSDLGWCPIAKEFHWGNNQPINSLLVINDEYSIYRKALAEGKIVQYLGQYSNMWHEVQEPDFNLHPTCYRIKPDEPKFKVGDFVTPLNRDINCSVWKIDKVLSCDTLASDLILLDTKTIQLWTPVKGEWCWFWDKPNSKYGTLTKFHSLRGSEFKSDNSIWTYCAPFIGKLPSYLKDK